MSRDLVTRRPRSYLVGHIVILSGNQLLLRFRATMSLFFFLSTSLAIPIYICLYFNYLLPIAYHLGR